MSLAHIFYDLHAQAHRAFGEAHGITKDRFVRLAEERFTLEPVIVDGEIAGVLALSGDSLHVAVKPCAKGRWLRQLQRFIERQGRDLVCETMASDRVARRFIERSGCVLVSEDCDVARYAVQVGKLWFKEKCR